MNATNLTPADIIEETASEAFFTVNCLRGHTGRFLFVYSDGFWEIAAYPHLSKTLISSAPVHKYFNVDELYLELEQNSVAEVRREA